MTGRKLGLRKRIGLNLFSDLYREQTEKHTLRTLFWECTLRCNLACRHCGSDCRVDPGVPDMPLADFLKVLDEEVTPHTRPGQVLIIFSGGEVLVRSDLEEAGREVTRRGYPWGMVTNGLALDSARLKSLVDAGGLELLLELLLVAGDLLQEGIGNPFQRIQPVGGGFLSPEDHSTRLDGDFHQRRNVPGGGQTSWFHRTMDTHGVLQLAVPRTSEKHDS